MKRVVSLIRAALSFLLIIGISFAASSQGFEGKITYKTSYKSKSPAVTDEALSQMMGTKQEYFYKAGDYKSVMNGALFQWQLYNSSDNKLYNKMANSESVYWMDAGENNDEVLNAVINKGVLEILGFKCDELVLTCKSGIQKYYFNSQFPVDPAQFKSHVFGNWFEYVSRAKSLPLKSIIENEQLVYEMVASEVKPMKLEKKLFRVEGGIKVEKSPF